jgi:glycosyltransferase involved in cell wall biosynthesis
VKTVAVFSLEPWDGVWRRNQHLIDRMLASDPDLQVVFVEPALDPLHDVRSGRHPRRGRGARTVEGYDGRLVTLEPTKWLPRAVPGGARALERAVARALRSMERPPDLVWVNDPQWGSFALGTGLPVLYDITDDWVKADRGSRQTATTAQADAALLAGSDIVVVCSPELERVKGKDRPVTLIPNAVDARAYEQDHRRPADLPQGRVAVYAGTLHEDRLDVDLAVDTARRLHEHGATLVFVGPDSLSSHNRQRLGAAPGLLLLGPRDHQAIPAYLTHADVLVVPHVVTPFTDSLDPIKLYEYLAARRPVVSTAVAGFRDRDGIAIRAGDDFVDAVCDLAVARRDRLEPAEVAGWPERAESFRALIDGLLSPSSETRG